MRGPSPRNRKGDIVVGTHALHEAFRTLLREKESVTLEEAVEWVAKTYDIDLDKDNYRKKLMRAGADGTKTLRSSGWARIIRSRNPVTYGRGPKMMKLVAERGAADLLSTASSETKTDVIERIAKEHGTPVKRIYLNEVEHVESDTETAKDLLALAMNASDLQTAKRRIKAAIALLG